MTTPRYEVRFSDQSLFYKRWRWKGRRFQIRKRDFAVERFVNQLARARQTDIQAVRMLKFRDAFYQIVANRPIVGLLRSAARGDAAARCLAIWLLGRIRNRRTARLLAEFSSDEDPRVRKRVTQALVRMEAWSDLRHIAKTETNPLVRRIAEAAEHPPRSYEDRLSKFLADDTTHVVETDPEWNHTGHSSLDLPLTLGDGKPPKPSWLIRTILERIRHLVHGRTA